MKTLDYTFQKSPSKPKETWRLDGRMLTRGDEAEIDLSTVKGGTFSDMPSGAQWVSALVLEHEGGTTKIACQDAPQGPSRVQYLALVFTLLGDLAAVSPEAAFRSGGGRIMTYVLLFVGIAFSLVGLYAIGGGALGRFPGANQFALSMGAMAMIFGLFLGWSGSPWSKPTTRSPRDLLDWLSTWLRHSRV